MKILSVLPKLITIEPRWQSAQMCLINHVEISSGNRLLVGCRPVAAHAEPFFLLSASNFYFRKQTEANIAWPTVTTPFAFAFPSPVSARCPPLLAREKGESACECGVTRSSTSSSNTGRRWRLARRERGRTKNAERSRVPRVREPLSRDLLHLPSPRSRVEFVLVQRESLRFAPIILAWKQVKWSPC